MYPHVQSSTICNSQDMEKTWKQLKCPLTDDWCKKMQCIYTNGTLLSYKKNEIRTLYLSKLDRERQIQYDITYMWNLKKNANKCLYKTDSENKFMVIKEELGEKEISMKLTDANYYI